MITSSAAHNEYHHSNFFSAFQNFRQNIRFNFILPFPVLLALNLARLFLPKLLQLARI